MHLAKTDVFPGCTFFRISVHILLLSSVKGGRMIWKKLKGWGYSNGKRKKL
ncbi:hypothetical protein EDD66_105214 [Mobilisporobacter senegalensis]|uniref:Uncharacterized protein n=1 Tax=Mobilisporobacter senegalensis TaxID=1329262 RepID=A0A3N1XNK6_9FIRM|nr:hypothetical protein EDD66_105214 [Mobilisporobacter senegalensis]